MDPIIHHVETIIDLYQLDSGKEHHSLVENILEDAMQALGEGTGFKWAGHSEGQMLFETAGYFPRDTSLVSGADGATNYFQVKATFTAPEATVVSHIRLYGSHSGRTVFSLWSTEEVNQSLGLAQDYVIYWTIHADV